MLVKSSASNDILILKELENRFFISKAREAQCPPNSDWQYWMLKAGRGYGKTRVGAEWTIKMARENPGCRIALVAPTSADARDVMVEGESGIVSISNSGFLPIYEPSKRRVSWANGSTAYLYSAEEPDRLRGPQHNYAWCDEIATWKYPETWDMLLFGLRLGHNPRAVITTTPRPTKLIKELIHDPKCVVTSGTTYENKDNLAPAFIDSIVKKYEGTRLGRQELNAEILDDNPNALWHRDLIENTRSPGHPTLIRVVVGVDPAVTSNEDSDETGIVAAGIAADGQVYVLNDYSLQGSPLEWGRAVVKAYSVHKADRVIGEVNNGGDLIEMNIKRVDRTIPFKAVHASRGKIIRAEPISALYEQGKVHHVGTFPQLEDQLCEWVPGEKSPDRMDALVWAITELTSKSNASPVILGSSRKW